MIDNEKGKVRSVGGAGLSLAARDAQPPTSRSGDFDAAAAGRPDAPGHEARMGQCGAAKRTAKQTAKHNPWTLASVALFLPGSSPLCSVSPQWVHVGLHVGREWAAARPGPPAIASVTAAAREPRSGNRALEPTRSIRLHAHVR
jgi:hypothetical protein